MTSIYGVYRRASALWAGGRDEQETHHALAEVVGVDPRQGSDKQGQHVSGPLGEALAPRHQAPGHADHAAEGGGQLVGLRQSLHGRVRPVNHRPRSHHHHQQHPFSQGGDDKIDIVPLSFTRSKNGLKKHACKKNDTYNDVQCWNVLVLNKLAKHSKCVNRINLMGDTYM